MDILRGPGKEKPWVIIPRRLPDDYPVPPELKKMGVTVELLRADLERRVENMSDEVANQLDVADFDEILDQAALEMCITGTGCIKGPFTVRDDEDEWGGNWDTNLQYVPKQKARGLFRPDYRWVPIKHIYPDMEMADVQKGSVIEEITVGRREFMELAVQPGFNPGAVLKVLKESPNGNYQPTPQDIQMRKISGDGRPSESNLYRYSCYCGEVVGRELPAAGIPVADDSLDISIRVMIYACGNYILYARPLKGPIPYYLIPYRKRATGGPFGVGVPMLIFGSQNAINGAARMVMDNAAIASGPIVEVNTRLMELQPGDDPADIHGWKVFITYHDGHSGKRAINIMSIPAFTDRFLMIIDLFRRLMDEESGQSSITGGQQGRGTTKTATGMSILNTNAFKTRNRTLGYIDDRGIEPIIEGAILWNHMHNPKEHILGPMRAMARGTHSVLAREIESQRLLTVLQLVMGHPIFGQNVEFIVSLVKRLMNSLGLPTEDLPVDKLEEMAEQMFGGEGMGQAPPPGSGPNEALAFNAANAGPQAFAPGAPPSSMEGSNSGVPNMDGLN